MHEIITLQLGHASNYLATHFWNFQESYFTYSENEAPLIDHDVHFRAGIAVDGTETFTPRTVIYDLKGGFGSLRRLNALYDVLDDSAPARGLWDGSTVTQRHQPIQQTHYQRNLELGLPTFQLQSRDVRYWSDFNRLFYHPRSIVQLNEYELNSQLMPFEQWSAGVDLYQNLDKEHDLLDRDVRPFAEECDQIQGLQIMTTADDAWGGFSSQYLQDLRDEFGKTSIWVWGLEDGAFVNRPRQMLRSCNTVRTLQSMGSPASAYIRIANPPSSLPSYVNDVDASDWLNTALVCTAMETSTISTRLSAGRHGSLSLFEAVLNTNGRQSIFELQSSVTTRLKHDIKPYTNGHTPHGQGSDVVMADLEDSDPAVESALFDIDFGPENNRTLAGRQSHVFAQVETSRGLALLEDEQPQMSPDERMRRRLNEEAIVERYHARVAFPRLDTFPDTLFRFDASGAAEINVRAGLTTTSDTKDKINNLKTLASGALGMEEREEIYNDLTELANAYSFGWDSGSDSDADE